MTRYADPFASSPRAISRAIAALAGGEILARVAAFAATAVLARRLGPEGFGIIGFATALCGYLALAVNGGLHEIGTREVARTPARAVALYGAVATARLLLAAAALVVLAAVAWILPKPPEVRLVVLLSGLSFFSLAVDPVWVFRGLERPHTAAAGLILAQGLYAIGVVLLIQRPPDLLYVPILQFGGEAVAALALAGWLIRHRQVSFAVGEGIRILRAARNVGLARLLRTIVITFDVVLLGFLATQREVGLYSAAYRVTFLLMAVVAAIAAAYQPSYARVVGGETAPTRRLLEASLGTAALVGAPLVIGTFVMAPQLLPWLFGAGYVDATLALRLLTVGVGVLFLHWISSGVLIVTNRTGLYAWIHGVAAAANIGLNLVLIPRFGIAGAAAATVAAEILVAGAGAVVLWRLNVLPSLRPALRPLAAAIVMGLAVWGAVRWPLPPALQVVIGAAVYVIVLASFGGLRSVRLSGLFGAGE